MILSPDQQSDHRQKGRGDHQTEQSDEKIGSIFDAQIDFLRGGEFIHALWNSNQVGCDPDFGALPEGCAGNTESAVFISNYSTKSSYCKWT